MLHGLSIIPSDRKHIQEQRLDSIGGKRSDKLGVSGENSIKGAVCS